VVQLYRASGRSLAKLAADLDVSIESLRSSGWLSLPAGSAAPP